MQNTLAEGVGKGTITGNEAEGYSSRVAEHGRALGGGAKKALLSAATGALFITAAAFSASADAGGKMNNESAALFGMFANGDNSVIGMVVGAAKGLAGAHLVRNVGGNETMQTVGAAGSSAVIDGVRFLFGGATSGTPAPAARVEPQSAPVAQPVAAPGARQWVPSGGGHTDRFSVEDRGTRDTQTVRAFCELNLQSWAKKCTEVSFDSVGLANQQSRLYYMQNQMERDGMRL